VRATGERGIGEVVAVTRGLIVIRLDVMPIDATVNSCAIPLLLSETTKI
jgi:hypothetical protein